MRKYKNCVQVFPFYAVLCNRQLAAVLLWLQLMPNKQKSNQRKQGKQRIFVFFDCLVYLQVTGRTLQKT